MSVKRHNRTGSTETRRPLQVFGGCITDHDDYGYRTRMLAHEISQPVMQPSTLKEGVARRRRQQQNIFLSGWSPKIVAGIGGRERQKWTAAQNTADAEMSTRDALIASRETASLEYDKLRPPPLRDPFCCSLSPYHIPGRLSARFQILSV
ncbi:unnamed protein product [Caenorhabditis auriculariae]|uniref:Uncharacterized protein n=1 Tax=Caenorhabditis auriculariae TaxID=2777116 RepID=A0A8S1HUB9_9PELO|nr:unnamed protein product [Caenorhabditis auriculariae]